jgi:hypothetical protein
MELWEAARSYDKRRIKPRQRKDGSTNMFCGFLYCSSCGFKMRSSVQKKPRKDGSLHVRKTFQCGTYSRCGSVACTPHTINEVALHQLLLNQIRSHAKMVESKIDRTQIIEQIIAQQQSNAISNMASYESELRNHRIRLATLDKLIEKLYEDRFAGIVPDVTFKNLIQKYEQERLSRQREELHLENEIQSLNFSENETYKWADIIQPFTEIETLDTTTLLALIDRIEISESEKVDGVRTQDVKIVYKYVGCLAEVEKCCIE